jgi:pre-mRNA cleavage complex 2 protein Pcf11
MAEAEKRGQHRSWYLDELDWIKTRESKTDETPATNSATAADSTMDLSPKKPKVQYIPVPADAALKNSVCPICQENFNTLWLDEAQEWVWMDAINVGGRIYHASCYNEAKRDRETTPAVKTGTPEPGAVLGKRKFEEESGGAGRTKIKTEPV